MWNEAASSIIPVVFPQLTVSLKVSNDKILQVNEDNQSSI